MQLQEIDKNKYRKNLKVVFAGIVVALIVIALSSSTLMIQLFGTPGSAKHFWFNLGGVVIAAIVVVYMLNKMRHHPFMFEVVYVWDLKQQLNRIYRKHNKIEPKIENNDRDAMIIMNFYYRGSQQLYRLDDNTITMDNLNAKLLILEEKMQQLEMSLSTDTYDPVMLEKY